MKRISKVVKIAKKLCREFYYVDNLNKTGGNIRKSWSFINNTLGRSRKSIINVKDARGQMILSDQCKADLLNGHFLQSVAELRQGIEIQPGDYCNSLRTLSHTRCRFRINHIQNSDMHEVISNMNAYKSPGSDGITPMYIRKCSEEITPILVYIFNKMIDTSVYPDILKMHKVVPIPKEPNATSLSKYRPIAILSAVDKIFEKILYDKFQAYLGDNGLIYDYQFGFRKGCSAQEAVLNVLTSVCKGLDDGYSRM